MAGADGRLIRQRVGRRSITLEGIDVRSTLEPLGVSRGDATHRWSSTTFARAVRTPDGPGSVMFSWSPGGEVVVDAHGPGTEWLLDAAPRWLGCHDVADDFDPAGNARLAEMWRRHGRFRLGGSGLVWHELAVTILGQRITSVEAMRSWRRMVSRWGVPAPGPYGLRLPPAPDAIATLSYVDLHRLGVERRRADALLLAARRVDRLEAAAAMPVADALDRLSALPGLGVWTATATTTMSHGDPDTVIIGDYGIPTMVSYAFTGSSKRVGDDRMMELLAPFAGHRWRVVRLLSVMGISAPRRAPRARNPRIELL